MPFGATGFDSFDDSDACACVVYFIFSHIAAFIFANSSGDIMPAGAFGAHGHAHAHGIINPAFIHSNSSGDIMPPTEGGAGAGGGEPHGVSTL